MRQTSILSFKQLLAEELIGKRQKEVYNAIDRLYYPTDREITQYLGREDPNYVRPRRKELEKMGLIFSKGKRKCHVSGRLSHTWGVV